MTDFNINAALADSDYPGIHIAGEFGAVEQYLTLLSQYLPVVRDQTSLRSKTELKRKYPKRSLSSLVDDLVEIDWVSNVLVPKFFLGSFVMAAWAAFEMASAEICAYVRKKESARLRLSDLRAADGWERVNLYLETIWSAHFAIAEVDLKRIGALQAVRNLYAHANGNLRFDRDKKRVAEIHKLVKASFGISLNEDDVLVSERFLRDSFGSLETAINLLITEIDKRYFPE